MQHRVEVVLVAGLLELCAPEQPATTIASSGKERATRVVLDHVVLPWNKSSVLAGTLASSGLR
jgi:hypothetical protein